MTESAFATGLPDLSGLAGTNLSLEGDRLARGEPWFATECAGLQFYAYGRVDELTGERIIPIPGDRLHLVRDPENEHDVNAVQVWWRNSHMLGHLPRYTAEQVASLLDAGAPARAYVYAPGDGEAWSLRVLVVGAAGAKIHGSFIEHVAWRANCRSDEENLRLEKLSRRAERTRESMSRHRRRRLLAAVETLIQIPCVPDLPEPYESGRTDIESLAEVLRCSRSTVVRIAAKAGISIRRYDGSVEVTPAFADEIRAWSAKPRKQTVKSTDVRVSTFYPETDSGGQYARGW